MVGLIDFILQQSWHISENQTLLFYDELNFALLECETEIDLDANTGFEWNGFFA